METEFSIYQLKSGDEYHYERFMSYDMNKVKNLSIKDYDCVYTGSLNDIKGVALADKLEQIFDKFNLDIPDDFKGHSLSVSDVISVGKTAYYVDDIGFTQMPDFFKGEAKTAEQSKKNDERGL